MTPEEHETKTMSPFQRFWDEVARLADKIRQKRVTGGIEGDELNDWLQAENEVKKNISQSGF